MSLCWLCPGQGSQTPEMLERLRADPLASALFEKHSRALEPETLAVAGDAQQCFLNRHAQALIVLYGVTVATALRTAGVEPALVAGYSVGELTAHAAAGALAPATVLHLARERARCMDDASAVDSGMLAVRGVAAKRLAAQATQAGVEVAIVNGADHAVLAGPRDALDALAAALAGQGAHVVPLAISVPAHTHWLAAGVAPFRAALEAAQWQAHEVPVPGCIDARPVATRAGAIDALARQIAEPLDWTRTLDVAREMGTTAFFELGPGSGLTHMVRERFPDLPARALDDFASLNGAIKWMKRHS